MRLLVVAALALACARGPTRCDGDWIELGGEVPEPGVICVARPSTVRGALAAARACSPGSDRGLRAGDLVRVGPRCGVTVGRMAPARQRAFGIPVDVNRADAGELASLPGIGPTLAARILEDRAARGPYRAVDDLARVHGIGPATVAKVKAAGAVASAPP